MSVQRIVEDSQEIDLQAESLHMTADTETPVSCIWHSYYQFPQCLQMRDRSVDYLYLFHAFVLLPQICGCVSNWDRGKGTGTLRRECGDLGHGGARSRGCGDMWTCGTGIVDVKYRDMGDARSGHFERVDCKLYVNLVCGFLYCFL